MSNVAYTGLPGSGKSYSVVEHVIIPALEAGRIVITNIPLNEVEIFKHLHDLGVKRLDIRGLDIEKVNSDPDYLTELPGGAVIVIDEVWRLWPSGLKASQVPEQHKSFFAEHRHKVGQDGRSQEIILVTQDLAQVAAFVRQLIEETFRSVKLTAVGQKNRFRIDVYTGAVAGNNPRGQKMREIFGKYEERVFRFYSSHTMSETGKAGHEEKVDKRGNVLKAKIIKYGIPGGIVAVLFGVYFAISAISGIFTKQEDVLVEKPITTTIEEKYRPQLNYNEHLAHADLQEQPLNEDTETPYSNVWRLGGYLNGYVDGIKKEMAVLIGKGRIRYIPTKTCVQIEGTPERECQVDGETVTFWSGQNMDNPAVTRIEKQI
ncbi:MAG: zonular occludens toxin domain-containing protein [Candidatus Sedimenticola sp. 6PFRAG7]